MMQPQTALQDAAASEDETAPQNEATLKVNVA